MRRCKRLAIPTIVARMLEDFPAALATAVCKRPAVCWPMRLLS